jgi:hypothetical protein
MDACALDQIAKLNTAHLSDSILPSDLESFPAKTAAAAVPTFTATKSLNFGKENNTPPPPRLSGPILPSTFTGNDKVTDFTSPVTPRPEKQIPTQTQAEVKTDSGVQAGEEVKAKKPSLPDFGEY